MTSSYLLGELHVCTCTELGCSAEQFRYEGTLHQGRPRGRQAGNTHDVKLRRLRKSQTNIEVLRPVVGSASGLPAGASNVRRRSLSTSDIPSQTTRTLDRSIRTQDNLVPPLQHDSLDLRSTISAVPTINNLQTAPGQNLVPDSDQALQNIHDSDSPEFCTDQFRPREAYLLRPSSLISMVQVAKASILNQASVDESRTALHLSKLQAEQSAIEHGYTGRAYWEDVPTTLPTLYRMLDLEVSLSSQISCPACFALHGEPSSKDQIDHKLSCDAKRFLKDPEIPREKHDKISRSECNENLYTTGLKPEARRIFYYQSLRTWLARMMFLPGFEEALDASLLHRKEDSSTVMTDVWDGEMWRVFGSPGVAYTSRSGNLVFGLYVDWFSPHGKSAQRRHSTGSILLICLNLPPSIRYKQENIFLFATIPGPQEPKVEQMNHLLRPLVAELQDFWRGILFTGTRNHPRGRRIRAALWPVIADLPAARKVAGFASHSAKLFCIYCALLFDDISETDIRTWPPRCDHQKHANEWNEAPSLGKQETIFSQFGCCWTVLSELPYWEPVDFISIDVMHCIALGMLRDHAISCLGIQIAGKKLKAHDTTAAARVTKRGRKEASASDRHESSENSGSDSRTENNFVASSSDRLGQKSRPIQGARKRRSPHGLPDPADLPSDPKKARTLECSESSSGASQDSEGPMVRRSSRLASRSRRDKIVELEDLESKNNRSKSQSDSDSTPRGSPQPSNYKKKRNFQRNSPNTGERISTLETAILRRITVSDLVKLHKDIADIHTPTWLTRLPQRFGTASAGSPKATEWLSLYSVYMVLSNIADLHSSEDPDRRLMCKSIIKAVEITNLCLSRTFSSQDGITLAHKLKDYRDELLKHWPGVTSKPNIHFAQHIPEFATRFGPPTYTACWVGERMNGNLVKIPKNYHMADLDKTMCTAFIRRGFFQARLHRGPSFFREAANDIGVRCNDKILGKEEQQWKKKITLEDGVYQAWLHYLNNTDRDYNDSIKTDVGSAKAVPTSVHSTQRLQINGKTYSSHQTHIGNSLVEFSMQGANHFGQIMFHFQAAGIRSTFIAIRPYAPLNSTDSSKNFYRTYPHLHASMVYDRIQDPVVIDSKDLMGHIVIHHRLAGSFGIPEATCSVVSLRNIYLE